MDDYTKIQKSWLDKRFSEYDQDGCYIAHQPIYGFRKEPSEPGHTFRYTITYHILRALQSLDFESFLDVGGGEGYKSSLIRALWGVKTASSDLSEQACRRANEIFSVPAVSADLHDLPFHDGAFDVVLCSESLEHVYNYEPTLYELLRVTKNVLIITVPHEDLSNIPPGEPHAHINSFKEDSFSFLRDQGYYVQSQKLLSPILTVPSSLVDARKREHNNAWSHPRLMTDIYNSMVPVARKIFGIKTVEMLVKLDEFLCRLTPWHNGLLFVIKKNEARLKRTPREVPVQTVLSYSVPKHHLQGSV